MVYYTPIYGTMTTYLAKCFGPWFNEICYTRPAPLLHPLNIAGTKSEISEKLEMAALVARDCGRTLMFPHLANQTV